MTIQKGFTLIELLIVIGIIALLATTIVLVLNPAQLLGQARDSQRISDLDTMRSAISLYLATADGTPAITLGDSAKCYLSLTSTTNITANCNDRHASTRTTTAATSTTARAINGTGWVPVDFQEVSGGSPLAVLPTDPLNNTTYFYSYAPDDTKKTFEIDANMESTRYSTSGGDDVESNTEDGGSDGSGTDVSANIYEVGTNLGL